MDVDERLLRYFVVLSEELHFGRAATRLYVSQPALSQQIRKLEERLHLRLFTRTSRQVNLTPAGHALLPRARSVVEALDLFRAESDSLARAQRSRLTVGFVAQAANELTPRMMRDFAVSHPGIDVNMRQSPLGDASGGLRSGRADIAIVRLPIEEEGLTIRPLFTEPRVAVLPSDHRLAQRGEIVLSELSSDPRLVTPTKDSAFRAFGLEGSSDTTASAAHVVHSIDELLEAVLAHRGIALAPESARRYYSRPGVAFAVVTDATPSVVAVAWRQTAAVSESATAFADLCMAIASENDNE